MRSRTLWYGGAHDTSTSHLNVTYYRLAIFCSVFAAVFWCYFNFLTAEDSLVLFNRYNFLEGAPVFFYYAGYWSLFPQSIAFLVSDLNPAIQAIAYSFTALSIFLVLLREVFRASHSGLAVISVAVLTAVFAPFMLFNLTYTFWPGLAILGLVGLRASYQKESLSFTDILICLPGLAGSPLGLLFLPLFVWAAFRKRSMHIFAIAVLALLSFLVLVERDGGHRASPEDIILRATDQIFQILSDQLNSLINTSSPNNLVMSVLGVLSVLFTAALGLCWLFRFRKERGAVLLYMVGSLATVAAAAGTAGFPLSGRYWYPIIICSAVLLGRFIMMPALRDVRRIAEPLLIVVLCGGFLSASALRVRSWGGPSFASQEWSVMLSPPDYLTALKRSWHEDAGWALGLGKGLISYEECAELWEHPSTSEAYGFRIYCGNGVFE